MVEWNLNPPTAHCDTLEPTDEDRAKAETIRTWIANTYGDRDDISDYEWNLSILAEADWVSWKNLGTLVSAVAVYGREVEARERAAKFADSRHVGEVEERLDLTLTVHKVLAHRGAYGTSHLHKMHDDDGNVYSWWSNGSFVADEGDTVAGRGTVKGHKTYMGINETELTRCKFKVLS